MQNQDMCPQVYKRGPGPQQGVELALKYIPHTSN